jgi:hypothetical protein
MLRGAAMKRPFGMAIVMTTQTPGTAGSAALEASWDSVPLSARAHLEFLHPR